MSEIEIWKNKIEKSWEEERKWGVVYEGTRYAYSHREGDTIIYVEDKDGLSSMVNGCRVLRVRETGYIGHGY